MRTTWRVMRAVLEQAWLPILLLVIWWYASAGSTNVLTPSLAQIWDAFLTQSSSGKLWQNVGVSLSEIVIGLAIAVVIGVALGTLVGKFRYVGLLFDPYLQFMRAIPQVAIVPIVIGALGVQSGPKIFSISFACIWPVLLNTIDGIRAIDPEVKDMTRAYGVKPSRELFRVTLPAALPQIMAGIRVSLSVSVILMVVAEMYSGTAGLGYFIQYTQNLLQVANTWMATMVVGILGYLLNALFLIVERSVLRWYHDSAK